MWLWINRLVRVRVCHLYNAVPLPVFSTAVYIKLHLLKAKLVEIVIKRAFHTSNKTQHFSIIQINSLMRFLETMVGWLVVCDNHTKPINTYCEQHAK
jgi:hypothetical protein